MRKIVTAFLSLLYVILPVIFVKSFLLFIVTLLLTFVLTFINCKSIDQFCIQLFIWGFSFFGLSVFGLKISDICLLIILVLILFHKRDVYVNKMTVPFLFFLAYIFVMSTLKGITSENVVELYRYIMSFLALSLFLQLRSNHEEAKRWINGFSVLVIMQAIIMIIVQKVVSFSSQLNFGPFEVTVFNDDSERRIAAFFSDPNKMMAFFSVLLLLQIFWFSKKDLHFSWHNEYLIYLLGMLITWARTSVIIVGLFLLITLVYLLFYEQRKLAYFIIGMFTLLFLVIVSVNSEFFINIANSFFNSILELFGRSRTAKIDGNITNDSRVIIWRQAFGYIKENVWFGHGLLSESFLLPIPTHNTFIQLLLDTGLSGLILYLMAIIVPIFKKTDLFFAIALIIVPMFFLDLSNFRMLFLLLGIVIQENRDEENENLCFN